jgi:adenine-specific DNA-methyltransferase
MPSWGMKNVLVSPNAVVARLERDAPLTVYLGDALEMLKLLPDECVDMVVTSPPYCMGKVYEDEKSVEQFEGAHNDILPEVVRITKAGGSICWQVGYHVNEKEIVPLDYIVHSIMQRIEGMTLRNRIVWTFGHGLHSNHRFSGRHEMVLWYTKGDDYHFDLNAVRIPQKYPGKRHYKGDRKGKLSGNPKGKNPADVWDIPNVKAKHIEKTDHPCQFPVGLVDRLIRALTKKNGLVCDPFMGSGSSGVAAVNNGRRFLGVEMSNAYVQIAQDRLEKASQGLAVFRSADIPPRAPKPTEKVSIWPKHFLRQQMKPVKTAGRTLLPGISRPRSPKPVVG